MTQIPILEGYGCRLRPVDVTDADFIVKLRNQPFAKGMIHSTSLSIDKQIEWIEKWQERCDDYYWIIEDIKNSYAPIGTIGFYDIEKSLSEGMPGRWVMLPQVNINIMSPFLLLYKFVFEELKINRVVMDVVETNKKVRRFHQLYGAKQVVLPKRYEGTEVDVGIPLVWYEFRKKQWSEMFAYWHSILEVY